MKLLLLAETPLVMLVVKAGRMTLLESGIATPDELHVRFVVPWWMPLFGVGVVVKAREGDKTTTAISVQT